MRHVLAASLAAAVAVPLLTAPAASAACPGVLRWHERPYLGAASATDFLLGATLRERAIRPGCNDLIINGVDVQPLDTAVTVRRIKDVHPNVAIAGPDFVYVSPSTFPVLPSHPLNKQLGRPVPWGTRAPCRVRGIAVVDRRGFFLRRGKQLVGVVVRDRTKIELRRYGTAYIPDGARLVIDGQRCERDGSLLTVHAKRIARAR